MEETAIWWPVIIIAGLFFIAAMVEPIVSYFAYRNKTPEQLAQEPVYYESLNEEEWWPDRQGRSAKNIFPGSTKY